MRYSLVLNNPLILTIDPNFLGDPSKGLYLKDQGNFP